MSSNFVKGLRLYLGKSQRDFAQETGISHSLVSLIESGHRELTDRTRYRIIMTYDLDQSTVEIIRKKAELNEQLAAS